MSELYVKEKMQLYIFNLTLCKSLPLHAQVKGGEVGHSQG